MQLRGGGRLAAAVVVEAGAGGLLLEGAEESSGLHELRKFQRVGVKFILSTLH